MNKQIRLKTPISYYGGKQRLVSKILPLIPKHQLYCEPFLGGAAVFFAKEKSKVEVINDTNNELINFYKVLQNRYHELNALVRVSLHSRELHDDANIIYNKPKLFDEVKRAWAVWVLATQSFSSQLGGSWGMDRQKSTLPLKITNKKNEFTEELAIRLQNVQIECADALYVIKSRDCADAFFYIDPPYYNANMGHYDGYTIEDFEMLLKLLGEIKGKFLLSSYPSDILEQYTKKHKWNKIEIQQKVSAGHYKSRKKNKIEVLTANYPI
jgi:DNA adenine methylase